MRRVSWCEKVPRSSDSGVGEHASASRARTNHAQLVLGRRQADQKRGLGGEERRVLRFFLVLGWLFVIINFSRYRVEQRASLYVGTCSINFHILEQRKPVRNKSRGNATAFLLPPPLCPPSLFFAPRRVLVGATAGAFQKPKSIIRRRRPWPGATTVRRQFKTLFFPRGKKDG